MNAPWPTEKTVLRRWFWIMHLEDMPMMSQRDGWVMRGAALGATLGLILMVGDLAAAETVGNEIAVSVVGLSGIVSLLVSVLGVGILWGKYTTLAEQSNRRLDRLEALERQVVPRDEIDHRLEKIELQLAKILDEVRR